MRSWYPRSFRTLLFVGFALVAVPLMIAVVNNAISIDRLGNLSEKAVYQAAQARIARYLDARGAVRDGLVIG